MEKKTIFFLKQLVNSLENKLPELEQSMADMDGEKFKQLKKECSEINKQIEDRLNEKRI